MGDPGHGLGAGTHGGRVGTRGTTIWWATAKLPSAKARKLLGRPRYLQGRTTAAPQTCGTDGRKREDKEQRRHHQAGSLATDMGTWEAPDRATARIAPDQRWTGLESKWGQHNGMQDHSARGRCRHNTGKWEMGNANGKWEVRMEINAGS